MKILFCLFFILNCISANAGEVVQLTSTKRATNLKFGISINSEIQNAMDIMEPALNLVSAVAPSGFIYEHATDSNFNFIIEVTTSEFATEDIGTHRAQGAILNDSADAYTMVLADHPNGPFIVRLFWDRLTTEKRDGRWVERSDAFTRVVAALGHEIYGNVRTFHEKEKVLNDPSHRYSDRFIKSDQAAFEIAAFGAGVETLERLIALSGSLRMPEKMQNDLKKAQAREQQAYLSWQKVESNLKENEKVISFGQRRCQVLFKN